MTVIQADNTPVGRPKTKGVSLPEQRVDARNRKAALITKRRDQYAAADTAHTTALSTRESVLRDSRAAVAADPTNSEACKALADAERWTQIQVDATGAALAKAKELLAEAEKSVEMAVFKVDVDFALSSADRRKDKIATWAAGMCAWLRELASAHGEDIDCPVGVEPKPSRQVRHALDCIVREHFAGHVAWLRYEQQCATLRATLEAPARQAIASMFEAEMPTQGSTGGYTPPGQIPSLCSTFEGTKQLLMDEYRKAHGLVSAPEAVMPEIEAEARKRFEAYRKPITDRIAKATAKRNSAIAALEAMTLEQLAEKHAADGQEMLQKQAKQAAKAAREGLITDEQIREAMTLLNKDLKQGQTPCNHDEAVRFAREQAAQAAYKRIMGTPTGSVTLPEAPTTPRPENLEWYAIPLAPYLEPPAEYPAPEQIQCTLLCIKNGTGHLLAAGAPAPKQRPKNQIPSIGEMPQLRG